MLLPAVFLSGQEIVISADGDPLNEVLITIRDDYDVKMSFDNKALAAYSINLKESFADPTSAFTALFDGLPVTFEQHQEVFIIFVYKPVEAKRTFNFSGQILDAVSLEPLPYSHVTINGQTQATDLLGNFHFKDLPDSVFALTASHLGYYVVDTSYAAKQEVKIQLTPSSVGLKEVVISNRRVERTTIVGSKPGLMKLNHKVANFLPGFGDNSVFNLLRLMPGILASGESTNDLIIWGSYAGQSQVLFDNFTIFGLKNFNDNISSFNPLMAKDIEVLKGGYDARYGERVGGIVNITGKNGNLERPSFSVTINNMTLNGMVEIPIAKKASISFALRRTYYNLYNPSDFNEQLRRNNDADTTNDIFVVPDYAFMDMNLKYTHNFSERDLFYVSLYGGADRFNYDINDTIVNTNLVYPRYFEVNKRTQETNSQFGGTVFYGRSWRNGNTSNFSFSYSTLVSDFADDYQLRRIVSNILTQNRSLDTRNKVDEFSLKVENRFALGRKHLLEVAGGIYANRIEISEDTFNIQAAQISDTARRVWSMVQDNISLGKRAILKVGARFTYAQNLKRMYAEPRISISTTVGKHFKFNAGWGIYNQFITKSSTVDDIGNYRYFWTICNNETIPVLQASHFVLGGSFSNRGWLISIEPYYKKVNGITRYFYSQLHDFETILSGESRMYGVDFFVQKDFKRHSAWVAYSLGKVEERWPDLKNFSDYGRAPQDQLHEVKLALLLNFDPFYFSTNYVYGSGFPKAPRNLNIDDDDLTYSRWDVSFIYKFLDRKVVGEVGISILNVLNTQNIKYSNFERIPAEQTNTINIYAESIPFTPTLYVKISM